MTKHKILWSKVRKMMWAWEHVQTYLSGDRDRVRCRRCAATADLLNEYRTKTSVHLEVARKHFYKCVVPNTALSENAGIKAATEPAQELFHGQA